MTGFVQRIAAGNNNTGVSSVTITVGTNTTGTGSLLVTVGSGNTAATGVGVTDTQSNSYARDYQANNTTTGGRNVEVWRCANYHPLTTSDTITVNMGTTETQGLVVIVDQFTALGAPDLTPAVTYSGSSVTTVAPSGTATVSDVVMYAACFPNGTVTAMALSGAFTATGTAQQPGSGICGQTAFLNAPTNASHTATFTWTSAHTCPAIILGYPAGAAPATSRLLLAIPF
jgi:hypothetical protein